jgi:streptogramin lyase
MKKMIPVAILLSTGAAFAQTPGLSTYPTPALGQFKNAIEVDASGNKWVAFKRIGLGKFDGSTWVMYDTISSSIPSNHVNDVAFDASGNVWAATIKGLAKFNGSTWTTYDLAGGFIPDDSVTCVSVSGVDVWAGTRNGLVHFNGSTWNTFTTTSGLTSNRINCVAVDASAGVYAGTINGLCKKTGSGWINFNDTDPYYPETYNVRSLLIDASGEVWTGAQSEIGSNLFKLMGTELKSWRTIYPSHSLSTSGSYPRSVSKGPHGGVLFYGTHETFGSTATSLTELAGSDVHVYTGVGANIVTLDPLSNTIWFCNQAGGLNIYSIAALGYPALSAALPDSRFERLDINQVNASISNSGVMHFTDDLNSYEVPKGKGRNPIFASALWIGGYDNGNVLHAAAQTYRQTGQDYWPGPLDTITGTTDSATCVAYDKIWKVDRFMIQEFITMFANGSVTAGTYIVDPNILSWPAHGTGNYSRSLAPFVDVNGDGMYNPLLHGDYPLIKGDQMCFWIFNDSYALHSETSSPSFKFEIHASAYAFVCDTIVDSLKALNYTTFYNYKIYNRGALNYHNTMLGIFEDVDVGSANDDYVGCNPQLNYGFGFNGDSIDDYPPAGQIAYGEKPPMISTVILNGPPAEPADGIDNNNNGIIDEVNEKNLMTHFQCYNNDFTALGNPQGGADNYNYMTSVWRDNTHVTYGGTGHLGSTPANFMFDSEPCTGWSECSVGNVPADRRFVLSCGPFNIDASQSVDFDYAIVFTQDLVSPYSDANLFHKNKSDVQQIQTWFNAGIFPSCMPMNVGITEITTKIPQFDIFPNPANEFITISFDKISEKNDISILDLSGRIIKNIKTSDIKTLIDISEIAQGMYLLRVVNDDGQQTKKFIKK